MMRGRGMRPCQPALVVGWIACLLWAMPVLAESGGSLAKTLAAQNSLLSTADDGGSSGDGGDSGSSYWSEHFRLHGYLTTAYAELSPDSDQQPNSSDDQILGLEEDGTWDYRIAALQLRYDPAPKHTLLVQLSHRKFGDSPLEDTDDDVELDWLFYQYRFTDNFSIKAGRVPVPVGIFNEFRDVGTLLPFFRPAYVFYREGSFVSETIDGAVLVTSFFTDSDWSLDLDLYYGEFDLLESVAANTTSVFEAEATDAYGAQLWLNTPVSGLRFGAGIQQYDVEGSGFHDGKRGWDTYHFSVDGVFDRFTARAEYKYFEIPSNNSLLFDGEIQSENYYFQLGFNVTESLGLWVQSEYSPVDQSNINLTEGTESFQLREDLGASLVYSLRPNIVLKGEYHQTSFETVVGVIPTIDPNRGLLLDFILDEFESDYVIISASFSF